MTEQVGRKIVKGSVLVIGGGITGMSVAIEAAEAGLDAHIVEQSPTLGGRVAQLTKYFPKLCPPVCGLEINYRRLRTNPNVSVHTLSRVTKIEGKPGHFKVTVEHQPRFVNERCTACNECVDACPVERPNPHDFNLSNSKGIYLPHSMAFPMRFAIDGDACQGGGCNKCVDACKYGAIDLDDKPVTEPIEVGAVVVATGWRPYDANKLSNLGFEAYDDVITNMMMERYANPQGPTKGKILCPSDGRQPNKVVFVQCAGSRDENHLPYCSGICCMASLKQAVYVRSALPHADVQIFYIDIRTPGRLEDFYEKVKQDPKVTLSRGKVARIENKDGSLNLVVEDTIGGTLQNINADLVVLATGMEPSIRQEPLAFELTLDHDTFGVTDLEGSGIIVAGCAKRPFGVSDSVQDATGAALRAIQSNVERSA